jgi:MSHA biogenesis protein MshJ
MRQWQVLTQKWTLLSKRDRIMLFVVGLFAIAGLMDTYLINPSRQKIDSHRQEIQTVQQETQDAQQELTVLQAAPKVEANPLQLQINTIKQEIKDQQTEISQVSGMMISPTESLAVLKKLLLRHKNVHVVSIETLAPESFLKKHILTPRDEKQVTATQTVANLDGVYQHNIKLQLSGSYTALLQYITDLKKVGHQIAWESAELKSKYPENELTIVVFTLSDKRVWMGI